MAPTIDIYDFVVKQGNGVKGLADTGIDTLPDRYILPPQDRLDPAKIVSDTSEDSIPVIDVSDWTDPKVADSICAAATKWGFFQIVNHGIPSEVLNRVRNAGHRFYALPNEERRKYWKGKSPSESVSLMTSKTPNSEAVLEWKDYLSFFFTAGKEVSSALWPSVCKDEILEYKGKADVVIQKLLEVLLKGLNVEQIGEKLESALKDSLVINFTHYPRCPNPELADGVGPHSDISTITVLLQDDTGGLYVRGIKNDCWIHVPPLDGALVINIGDVLQIMSNDRYKSIEHRVVANKNKNRISVPIFVNPAADAVFGPLPEALEAGGKPVYREVVFSDYFKYFFSKSNDGKKTLEYVRI